MKPIYQQVYDVLMTIPRGKVTTYGGIGKKLQINPRYVGRILHMNPNAPQVPCHRVVMSGGKLAGGYARGGNAGQMEILESEGVRFKGDRVLHEYLLSSLA